LAALDVLCVLTYEARKCVANFRSRLPIIVHFAILEGYTCSEIKLIYIWETGEDSAHRDIS